MSLPAFLAALVAILAAVVAHDHTDCAIFLSAALIICAMPARVTARGGD